MSIRLEKSGIYRIFINNEYICSFRLVNSIYRDSLSALKECGYY